MFDWPDGRRYEGKWRNGKQDGIGMYINSEGIKKYGRWDEGRRVAWITAEEYRRDIES